MRHNTCSVGLGLVALLLLTFTARADEPPAGMSIALSERVLYQPGPYERTDDARPRPDTPRGTITRHVWSTSKVYPGTLHEYWVYVPAQYQEDASQPAAVMVFQDGHNYVAGMGAFHATTVMDNLIAAGDMPITIGIFIEPGHRGETLPKGYWGKRNNRSVEYDTPDDTYARFLIEEILPEVGRSYRLTDDPNMRAIVGASSGGICAFKCAWHRPDYFRKVHSSIGSFTNIRGGHVYPALIRKEQARPIRVYLQAGMNDLDNAYGNWWLANQQMARALAYKDRYDYRFVAGNGGHSSKHGAADFPEAMRWLWRDWDGVERAESP